MTALVSIVIPCYNAARWLPEAVESALAQTYSQVEIIIVDDGSTDCSLAVAKQFESRGVRVFTQPNSGASAARNHGMQEARGAFVQFLDADDVLSPDKIAAQVTLLSCDSNHQHVASCRWGRFTTDVTKTAFVDHDVFRDLTAIEFLLLATAEARMMHPAAWLVPREVANRAGTWNESLSVNDDGEYFARVVACSGGIRFSPIGCSHYRSALSGSLSGRRSLHAMTSLHESGVLITRQILALESSARVGQALAEYWHRMQFELYPEAPALSQDAGLRSRTFGRAKLPLPWPAKQRLVAKFVGWRLARRIGLFVTR